MNGLKLSRLVRTELPFPSPHCFFHASFRDLCSFSPSCCFVEGISMGTLKQEPELRCLELLEATIFKKCSYRENTCVSFGLLLSQDS